MYTHNRRLLTGMLFALTLFIAPALYAQEEGSQESKAHLPIVLVHGILADSYSMLPVERMIYKNMPGTYVKNIQLGVAYVTSFFNMYNQVDWLRREIENDPMLQNGFNIIAHSQGGLVARYYVERYNEPKVHNLITLCTPHMGVFGTPGTLDSRFVWLNLMELYAHRILYSHLCQRYVSFAGYWRDTLHYDNYLQKCRFLPFLNNEVHHSYSILFKRNMTSLQNFVMISSTDEDLVEPVASCHFGFYKVGSISDIEDLFDSKWYHEDTLGLRTLNESGRLHMRIAHARHEMIQADEDNFMNNVLPFLTLEKPVPEQPVDLAGEHQESNTNDMPDGAFDTPMPDPFATA